MLLGISYLFLIQYTGSWMPGLSWGIPVFNRPFNDLQIVLYDIESARQGFDPYTKTIDPFQLHSFYPRIWFSLANISFINPGNVLPIAGLCYAVFAAAVGSLIYRITDWRRSMYWLLLLLSPAVLFALERCNTDLLIFALLVLSIELYHSTYRKCSIPVWWTAVALKLVPVFSISLFWTHSMTAKKRWTYLFIAASLCLGYFAWIYKDLAVIGQASIPALGLSYGSMVLPYHIIVHWGLSLSLVKKTVVLLVAVLFFLAFQFSLKDDKKLSVAGSKWNSFFLAGAGMYIGTFSLGYNYDYKLIFLLMTIPALLQNYSRGCKVSLSLLVGIPICLWSNFLTVQLSHLQTGLPYISVIYWPNAAFIWIEELLNWFIAFSLLRVAFAFLPRFSWKKAVA